MSRPQLPEPVDQKHDKLISLLKNLDKPWGLAPDLDIPFPGFGKEFTASVNLSKLFAPGIKMDVFYRYRNKLEDHHSNDDRIYIEFESKKIDYEFLVLFVFPQIIKCFEAYTADIYDRQLMFKDFEEKRFANRRKFINRVYPVSFYDNEICDTFFKRSPREIINLLEGEIYKAEIFNGGILVVGDIKPYTVEQSIEFENKIKAILQY
jgi:hypothetical protein